jgi:hydroxymethylbilane synthase
VLSPQQMLPAVGQGAIGIECRADDTRSLGLLAAIDHPASSACVRAERALLAALDGSCHTPIAGHAEIAGGLLHLRALIARPDGSACLRAERVGAPEAAEKLGQEAGLELRARVGPGFFD